MKILVAILPFVLLPLASAQDLIPGKGKEKVETICGACHGLEGVVAMNNSKSSWEDLIDDMRGRGADGTEDDFKAIATYLAKYYGPMVQVNKASAKDLSDQLEITPDEAAAIVVHREGKGGIKDWDDLAKTPGLTASKIEPLQEAPQVLLRRAVTGAIAFRVVMRSSAFSFASARSFWCSCWSRTVYPTSRCVLLA